MVQAKPATTGTGIPAGTDEPSIQRPTRRAGTGRPSAPRAQATFTGRPGHSTTAPGPGPGRADPGTAALRRRACADIAYRQRRYLLMMGSCIAVFWLAVSLILNRFGWLAVIPAVAAIPIIWVAIVFANAGHELDNVRGFADYRPNLAEPRVLPAGRGQGDRQRSAADRPAQDQTRNAA